MKSKVARRKAIGVCAGAIAGVMPLALGLLLPAGLLLEGCTEMSEIVLVVDTEMAVPAEIDAVQISITGPTHPERAISIDLKDPSAPTFPLTLGLTATDHISPITILLAGVRAGGDVVTEVIRSGFVAGQSRMLRSVLTAACLDAVCSDAETCVLGVCVPRDRPANSLPSWPGRSPARPGIGGLPIGGRSIWPGGWRTCATKEDRLYCWGDNEKGQLGHGDPVRDVKTRTPVLGLPYPLDGVGLGNKHSCVCDKTGQGWCWGRNDDGQLGTNDLQMRIRPTPVPGLTDCLQIAGGGAHTCVVHTDARVSCWGLNTSGQAGQPTTARTVLTPQIVPGLGSVVEVVAGESFACAFTTNSIQCWGDNSSGQLGDGTVVSRSSPVRVSPQPDRPTRVVAGRFFACALLSSGGVSCWGQNSAGLLGSARNPTPTPVDIVGISDAIQLGAGHEHACVVRRTGIASCWGSNQYGQLGDGSPQTSSIPVDVVDIAGVTEIAPGYAATCARHAAGISCWGQNTLGQLGDGSELPKMRPVGVIGF